MLVMNRFRIWGNKHTNCGQACLCLEAVWVWAAGKNTDLLS